MEVALLAAVIALWIAFVVQSLFILSLFRYVGVLIDRTPPESLPVGKEAPVRRVTDINRQSYVLGRASHVARLLVFVSESCPWCDRLIPHIAPFAAETKGQLEVLVVNTA